MTNKDIYKIVTNRIIEGLKQGNIPWKQSWQGLSFQFPKNFTNKKEYRGINTLILWFNMCNNGFTSPYYLTFNQVKKLKGKVKKGSKSELIVYWNWIKKDSGEKDKKGKPIIKNIPLLKYYRVFNIEQTEGIEFDKPVIKENNFNTIKECEKFIENFKDKPCIQFKEQSAFYNPLNDYVNMPKKETFENEKYYYSTLFHELVHSTGHKERLNRLSVMDSDGFGKHEYSKEELIAEIGTSFLCSILGIRNENVEKNQQAYINHWINQLENDEKLILSASSHAQKAVDYMQGKKFEEKI